MMSARLGSEDTCTITEAAELGGATSSGGAGSATWGEAGGASSGGAVDGAAWGEAGGATRGEGAGALPDEAGVFRSIFMLFQKIPATLFLSSPPPTHNRPSAVKVTPTLPLPRSLQVAVYS